jgi:hypothetical protein
MNKIAVYKKIGSESYVVNTGAKDKEVDRAELVEMKERYTMIEINLFRDPINVNDKDGNRKTLTEMRDLYNYYLEAHKALYKATGGHNCFKKDCTSFSQIAMYAWNGLKKRCIYKESESLGKKEIEILKDTNIGAIIFSEKEYEGEGYMYDYVSFYPSILADKKFNVPIKEPIEKTIKKWSEAMNYGKLHYGFYRCKIERSESEVTNRLFRFNEKNIYTHIDVELAHALKLKFKLITDGEPNMFYYPGGTHRELSWKIFLKFVSTMFKHKQQKVKGAKEVLNSLWGALCQKSNPKKARGTDNEMRVVQYDDGAIEMRNEKTVGNPFRYSWARIKPFLLAQGRYILSTNIMKYGDKIVRANTDGFISKVKLDDIVCGDDLGMIKYEGMSYYIKVHNANSVEGKTKKDMVTEEDDEDEVRYKKIVSKVRRLGFKV